DKLWASVCEIVGRSDLVADPRFVSVRDRAKNQTALAQILSQAFRTRHAATWLEEFARAGVPASLIASYSEAVDNPHVAASGWVQPMALPSGAVTRNFVSALRLH